MSREVLHPYVTAVSFTVSSICDVCLIRCLPSSICIIRMWHVLSRGGVETQKNVRGDPGEIGGWGRVPFNEPYAPSLSTIYDGA